MMMTQSRLMALAVAAVVSLLASTAVAQLAPSRQLAPQKTVSATLPSSVQVNQQAQAPSALPNASEYRVDLSKQAADAVIAPPHSSALACNGEEVLSTHWGWLMQYIEDTQGCFAVIYAPPAKDFTDTGFWTPGPKFLFVTIPTTNPQQARFCTLLSEHLLKAGTNVWVGVHGNTCNLDGKTVLKVGDMGFFLQYPLVGNIQHVNVLAPALY